MKTTVEIPQTPWDGARKLAPQEGTTWRLPVEEGLRRIIAGCRRAGAFRLRKATFKGTGLRAGGAGDPWERVRDMAYERRGG
jgi:hypothetical protein